MKKLRYIPGFLPTRLKKKNSRCAACQEGTSAAVVGLLNRDIQKLQPTNEVELQFLCVFLDFDAG